MTEVEIGIARTEPAWNGHAGVREVESLHLASIAAAERWIFMENQYFASEIIADAIAARLSEPTGPEVLVVSAFRSPGFSDHLAMDSARHVILRRLRQADRFGRFRAYAPVTAGDMPIIVHSKVTVIDERLVRIGSANINNRSMGFDTECDLALDPDGNRQDGKPAVDFLCRLLAEHMGASSETVADALHRQGCLHGAVLAVNPAAGRRLVALDPGRPPLLERVIGRYHLLDPSASTDNWRPWRRRSAVRATAPSQLAGSDGRQV